MIENLEQLAAEINARLTRKERSADHRLAAGLQLIQAKTLVKAQRCSWMDWVAQNIKQSPDAVRKAMTLATKGALATTISKLPATTEEPDVWDHQNPVKKDTLDRWSEWLSSLGTPRDGKVFVGPPTLTEDGWQFQIVVRKAQGVVTISTMGDPSKETAKRLYDQLPNLIAHLRPDLTLVVRRALA